MLPACNNLEKKQNPQEQREQGGEEGKDGGGDNGNKRQESEAGSPLHLLGLRCGCYIASQSVSSACVGGRMWGCTCFKCGRYVLCNGFDEGSDIKS